MDQEPAPRYAAGPCLFPMTKPALLRSFQAMGVIPIKKKSGTSRLLVPPCLSKTLLIVPKAGDLVGFLGCRIHLDAHGANASAFLAILGAVGDSGSSGNFVPSLAHSQAFLAGLHTIHFRIIAFLALPAFPWGCANNPEKGIRAIRTTSLPRIRVTISRQFFRFRPGHEPLP